MTAVIKAPVSLMAMVAMAMAMISGYAKPVGQRVWGLASNTAGDIRASIGSLIGGLILIVIGLVLSTIINAQAATNGSAANIGSFTGAQSFNDLVPMLFIVVIVMIAVGMIGVGGAGFAGKGPLGR